VKSGEPSEKILARLKGLAAPMRLKSEPGFSPGFSGMDEETAI
jgi:hypothetical protein